MSIIQFIRYVEERRVYGGGGVRERVKNIHFDLWPDNEMCVPVCSAIVQRIRERRPGRQAGTNEWAFPSPPAENMENYRKFSVNWFLGLSIGWWWWRRRRFFSSLNTAFVRAQSSRQGKFMQMAVTAGLVVWMRFFLHRAYLPLIDPNEWVCFKSGLVLSLSVQFQLKKNCLINVWSQVP